MAEGQADPGHDALFERIFLDRDAGPAAMKGRVDMGAGVVRHRDDHRSQPMHISGFHERILMRLPDGVEGGRMSGIAGSADVELASKIDNLHDWYPFLMALAAGAA